MNILITGIGGPTPRSIAGRLKTIYPNHTLIGTDCNPKALGFYMEGLVDKHFKSPHVRDENYWNFIFELIEREKIDFAFVQPEQEVKAWAAYYDTHGKYPCPVLIPPTSHVTALMNKANMADLLKGTGFIPDTITIENGNVNLEEVGNKIGYPCWIRASVGSGGLGSLKLNSQKELGAWLFIHKDVPQFTVSGFLTGRHLANQMLYIDGELIKNAGLECVEYVMADIAPSKVTGNTSYGRFINEEKLLAFCEEVMDFIQEATQVKAHGVYSFDLKEDSEGNLKVTEINIRHMAYTGIMAKVGFDLMEDTVNYLTGKQDAIQTGRHYFDKEYIFLRDVDIAPIVLTEQDLLK